MRMKIPSLNDALALKLIRQAFRSSLIQIWHPARAVKSFSRNHWISVGKRHKNEIWIPLRLQRKDIDEEHKDDEDHDDPRELEEMQDDTKKGIRAIQLLDKIDPAAVKRLHVVAARGPMDAITRNDLVDDKQIAHIMTLLRGFTNLTTLQFSPKSRVIPQEILLMLKNLRHMQVAAIMVPHVCGLKTLEALTIVNTPFDKFSAEFSSRSRAVSSKVQAQIETLIRNNGPGYIVKDMPNLKRLQVLDLVLSGNSRHPLIDFRNLPQLKHLSVRSNRELPRFELKTVGDPSSLETLHLINTSSNCQILRTAKGLRHLILEGLSIKQKLTLCLSKLEVLEVIECQFGADRLLDLSSCPRLKCYLFSTFGSLVGEGMDPLQTLSAQLNLAVFATSSKQTTEKKHLPDALIGLQKTHPEARFLIMSVLKDLKLQGVETLPAGFRSSLQKALKKFDTNKRFITTRLGYLDDTVGDPHSIAGDRRKSFMPIIEQY